MFDIGILSHYLTHCAILALLFVWGEFDFKTEQVYPGGEWIRGITCWVTLRTFHDPLVKERIKNKSDTGKRIHG